MTKNRKHETQSAAATTTTTTTQENNSKMNKSNSKTKNRKDDGHGDRALDTGCSSQKVAKSEASTDMDQVRWSMASFLPAQKRLLCNLRNAYESLIEKRIKSTETYQNLYIYYIVE